MNASSKRWAVRPVVRAAMLALVAAGGAHAGPMEANWTLDVLATAGVSSVVGIDGSGRVGGANSSSQVLRWGHNGQPVVMGTGVPLGMGRNGSLVGTDAGFGIAQLWLDIGTAPLSGLGGNSAFAKAVNDSFDVVGAALTPAGSWTATRWRSGQIETLGPANASSYAYGLNAKGSVVGFEFEPGVRGFIVDTAGYRILPAPAGATANFGLAINDSGTVLGYAEFAGRPGRGWLYDGQNLRELASPGTFVLPNALNNANQVVGYHEAIAGSPGVGFLHAGGRFNDLNNLPGVAGQGIAVVDAAGINDLGQIAVLLRAGPDQGAGRLTLTTNVWSSLDHGSWSDAANWSYGTAPNRLAHVVIDPTRATQVLGPDTRSEVAGLTVGTDNNGGGGVATLYLRGGTVAAVGGQVGGPFGFTGVWVGQNGVLTGDGTIRIETSGAGALHNYGTVIADNLRVQGSTPANGTLINHGLIVGNGFGTPRLVADKVENQRDGRIRVLRGERLTLEGGLVNLGSIEILGGQFTHFGSGGVNLRSDSAQGAVGRMAVQDGLLTMSTGLVVDGGQLLVSGGSLNNVFGRVTVKRGTLDGRGGQVILSGNSQTTFYEPVEVMTGAELRVSTGSTAVFFGQVFQRSGALFTGSGRKFYEGGLAIGNSPGIGRDDGDVDFGAGNVYEAEIGGTVPGDGHDQYIVGGHLTFGGTLKLVSWAGFVGSAGQRFDLFDWGTASGQFDAIDAGSFLLTAGTVLDTSRLYIDGSLAVQAVPEPATWALLAGGGWLLFVLRCRGRGHGRRAALALAIVGAASWAALATAQTPMSGQWHVEYDGRTTTMTLNEDANGFVTGWLDGLWLRGYRAVGDGNRAVLFHGPEQRPLRAFVGQLSASDAHWRGLFYALHPSVGASVSRNSFTFRASRTPLPRQTWPLLPPSGSPTECCLAESYTVFNRPSEYGGNWTIPFKVVQGNMNPELGFSGTFDGDPYYGHYANWTGTLVMVRHVGGVPAQLFIGRGIQRYEILVAGFDGWFYAVTTGAGASRNQMRYDWTTE